jgi:hypothetical protein
VTLPGSVRSAEPFTPRDGGKLRVRAPIGATFLVVGAFLPYVKLAHGVTLSFVHVPAGWSAAAWGQVGRISSILLLLVAALAVSRHRGDAFWGGVLFAGGWILFFTWCGSAITAWWGGDSARPSGLLVPIGCVVLGMEGRRMRRESPTGDPAPTQAYGSTGGGMATLLLLAAGSLVLAYLLGGPAGIDPRHLVDLNGQTLWNLIGAAIALRLILRSASAVNVARPSPFLAGALLWMGVAFFVGAVGASVFLAANSLGMSAVMVFAGASGLLMLLSVRAVSQPTRRRGA